MREACRGLHLASYCCCSWVSGLEGVRARVGMKVYREERLIMRRGILEDILSPHCDFQMGGLRGYSKLRASTDPRGM